MSPHPKPRTQLKALAQWPWDILSSALGFTGSAGFGCATLSGGVRLSLTSNPSCMSRYPETSEATGLHRSVWGCAQGARTCLMHSAQMHLHICEAGREGAGAILWAATMHVGLSSLAHWLSREMNTHNCEDPDHEYRNQFEAAILIHPAHLILEMAEGKRFWLDRQMDQDSDYEARANGLTALIATQPISHPRNRAHEHTHKCTHTHTHTYRQTTLSHTAPRALQRGVPRVR